MSDPTIVSTSSTSSPDILTTILGSVARHGLTTAGGWLAGAGVIDKSDEQAFIGGGMVVAGVLWSWWQKRGQALVVTRLKSDLAKVSSMWRSQVLANSTLAASKSDGPVT